MSKTFVIMMMGFTAVGKSTTAKKLSQVLDCNIYHSAVTRKDLGLELKDKSKVDEFFDITSPARLEMDRAVYGENAKRALRSLEEGKNVILDAGYFFVWQREQIYEIAAKTGSEVFIVNVVCDEAIIHERMKQRDQKFSDHALNETPSMYVYESTKRGTEFPKGVDKLSDDSLPIIIEYDSETKKINVSQDNAAFSFKNKIISALESL